MTGTPYDSIADWYDEQVRVAGYHPEGVAHERSAFDSLLEDITDREVCDLGCGQGAITRRLALGGAKVVGIDISERLLQIAKRQEAVEPQGITYLQDDARHLSRLRDRSFDGVVCTWSLLDIDDLTACIKAVARILRPDGWFVFVITHPCFQAPGSRVVDGDRLVGSYFKEGFWRSDNPEGVRGVVGAYHRTLSTYVNGLVNAGLIIEWLIEPQGAKQSTPDRSKVPAFLMVRCREA